MPQKTFSITASSPKLNTLSKFLALDNSLANKYVNDVDGFLKIMEYGLTNEQRILNSLSGRERLILEKDGIISLYDNKEPNKILIPSLVPIKQGTVFYVEAARINDNYWLTEGIKVVEYSDAAFKAKALANLESDRGYVAINKPIQGQLLQGISTDIYPNLSVWMWIRSLSPSSDENGELSGQIMDLTPFILKCTTNMGKNGGNWSLSLPAITCDVNDEGKWSLRESDINKTKNGDEYYASSSIFDADYSIDSGGSLSKNNFMFSTVIKPNDLIFIKYETLKIEAKQRYDDAKSYFIDKSMLPNRIYDMIGLVDSNTETINPQSNDVSINITGRDLSKLFIEDGTYFYSFESSQGMLKLAGGSQQQNDLLQRVFTNNGSFIDTYKFKNISYIIKFVIQQLSSIKIVPNDLFNSYTDSNKKFRQFNKDENISKNDIQKEEYKKSAIKLIATQRANVGLVDSNEIAKQNEIFSKLISFITYIKYVDIAIIENFNITGWKTNVYNGEPLDANTYPNYFLLNLFKVGGYVPSNTLELIKSINDYINKNRKTEFKPEWKEELANGIWQIVDLVIDNNISNRITADSSMSSAQGSILNFIHTAVQEPLAEFYMDTYGDKYTLIARKPPTDQSSIISLLEGKPETEDGVPAIQPAIQPAIIDILASDVLQSNLVMNDSQVYSWYHFIPKNGILGTDDSTSTMLLPAVFLKEYADVWGSKPFQQVHNYLPFELLQSNELDACYKQCANDLKFVIESNAYLPFTRRGMLVVNGDRRIKIGNYIRYLPTSEIFYVEAVQQNFAISENGIERTTTIQVTRGMVESLIYGVHLNAEDGSTKFVSYFNLVDTRLNYEKKQVTKERTVKKPVLRPLVVANDKYIDSGEAVQLSAANFSIAGQYGFTHPEMVRNAALINNYTTYKGVFTKFVNEVTKLGYTITITDGLRPLWMQIKEFKKNPEQYDNVMPSSNAPHIVGMAIDINLLGSTGEKYTKGRSTKEWNSTGVPALAKSMGLKWGGEFNMPDNVHFQIHNEGEALTKTVMHTVMEDSKEKYTETGLDDSVVFKNFKVNPFTFNWFLKSLQFDKQFRNVTSRQVFESDAVGSPSSNVIVT